METAINTTQDWRQRTFSPGTPAMIAETNQIVDEIRHSVAEALSRLDVAGHQPAWAPSFNLHWHIHTAVLASYGIVEDGIPGAYNEAAVGMIPVSEWLEEVGDEPPTFTSMMKRLRARVEAEASMPLSA